MAAARKKATAKSLPKADAIPEGMTRIGKSYAPSWDVEAMGILAGKVTDIVREVTIPAKGKRPEATRRVFEVTTVEGERFTVWESASLSEFFDAVADKGEGAEVWIRYDGLGKKKPGQNPPKLFTPAIG